MTIRDDGPESGQPTDTSPPAVAPTSPQPEAIITTAEIPRVSVAPSTHFPRTADAWHPDVERRLPAPWGLELAVWLLFVLFVVGLIGLAIEHFHPSWVAFLRNTVTTTHQRSARGTTSSTAPSASGVPTSQSSAALGKLVLVSATKNSVTYSVPTSKGFSLVVSTANPCWTQVKSPPTSAHYLFAATITPKQSPEVIELNGPASVVLGAHASALTIKVGSTKIGSITTPRPLLTYTFAPTRR